MTGSLEVTATGAAADAIATAVPTLVEDRVASRLFSRDATLWGPEAETEASVRLAWVDLPRASRPLLGQVAAMRSELAERGVDRVVLCGMGGSSLAPEVACATYGVPLTVVDSSQPDAVRSALDTDLARTVVVVSSKSGSTVETDSQRRVFEAAFREAGLAPTEHVVFVTDPGSALDERARAEGFPVVNADPDVGGRYSALTAFGLVPCGLAGVDLEDLLDDAESVADLLAEDDEANPALRLAAAMAATEPLRDKLVLVDEGSGLVGFGDWAEQLIAESTGKSGTGVLPVVVEDADAPEVARPPADATVVHLVPVDADEDAADGDSSVSVAGGLGAQFLLWEAATAVAGRLLDINPFDQPDVETAKKAARGMLDATPGADAPAFVADGVEVRALGGDWLGEAQTLEDAVTAVLGELDERGYAAVMAYLDRHAFADLADARRGLAARTGRPTTFGWGPRFLHSTGQYHKGGPRQGVYVQVTTDPAEDLPVPGQPFGLGQLVAAQAAGDAQVLAELGRPVLRLHVTDAAGVARVTELLR